SYLGGNQNLYGVDVHPGGNYVAIGNNTYATNYGRPLVVKNPAGPPTFLGTASGLTTGCGVVHGVEWSPDGAFLAVACFANDQVDVYSFNSSTDTFTPATIDGSTCTGVNGWGRDVSWSPDGTYLAVASQ